jgi:hypothetical protein
LKRTLITAAALYILYERQRRVERRQKLWKLRTEADMRHWGDQLLDANRRWATETVDQINKAFREGAA